MSTNSGDSNSRKRERTQGPQDQPFPKRARTQDQPLQMRLALIPQNYLWYLEQQRVVAERAERERQERLERLERERQERLERLERERQERLERLEQERLERERQERLERFERERQERLERLERERQARQERELQVRVALARAEKAELVASEMAAAELSQRAAAKRKADEWVAAQAHPLAHQPAQPPARLQEPAQAPQLVEVNTLLRVTFTVSLCTHCGARIMRGFNADGSRPIWCQRRCYTLT
jgi:hypothetical protein